MSDDKTPPEGDGAGNGDEFKAITTQKDFERALGDRLKHERAKFPDYEAMKTKAAAFDTATEANKTELQKERDLRIAAETKVGGYEQRDQVTKWAKDAVKGSNIPADALRGNTEDEIKAHFEQLKAIAAPTAPTTRRTAVPAGKSGTDSGGSRAVAALRQFRGSAQ